MQREEGGNHKTALKCAVTLVKAGTTSASEVLGSLQFPLKSRKANFFFLEHVAVLVVDIHTHVRNRSPVIFPVPLSSTTNTCDVQNVSRLLQGRSLPDSNAAPDN